MSKKAKQTETKKSGKSGATVGKVIGTVIRSIVVFLGFVFKVIVKTCALFGLWIPIVYALFGLILYWALDFNPFRFDTLGTLYLCGGIACIIGAAIISVRNFIVKPVKSIYDGYKHPLWEKPETAKSEEEQKEISKWQMRKSKKEEERFSPPEIEDFRPAKKSNVDYGDLLAPLADFEKVSEDIQKEELRYDWLPKNMQYGAQKPKVVAAPPVEKPQVYFSTLEPDVLVHEYSDRFELYKVSGHRTIPIGVEYKQ